MKKLKEYDFDLFLLVFLIILLFLLLFVFPFFSDIQVEQEISVCRSRCIIENDEHVVAYQMAYDSRVSPINEPVCICYIPTIDGNKVRVISYD